MANEQQIAGIDWHAQVNHPAPRRNQARRPDIAPVLGRGTGENDDQLTPAMLQGLGNGVMAVRDAVLLADGAAQRGQARAQGISGLVQRPILNGFRLGLDQGDGFWP